VGSAGRIGDDRHAQSGPQCDQPSSSALLSKRHGLIAENPPRRWHEARLNRVVYGILKRPVEQDAEPAEIRGLRGDLDPTRSRQMMGEVFTAGLPT
jgi:hypothetical protein